LHGALSVASAVVVQLHRTTPRGCRVVASVPRWPLARRCVAVSTLERDLVLDPDGLHDARSPLRRKWRRMTPFTADSTSWCRRAPACAALNPLRASG